MIESKTDLNICIYTKIGKTTPFNKLVRVEDYHET